jgi:site-specific DNA-adenine methylase
MTNLWIQGTFGVPLQFHVTPTIVSTQIYKLNATLLTNAMITNVHFSQVIFNTVDIESSN